MMFCPGVGVSLIAEFLDCMDGQMAGWIDRQMDGWMDIHLPFFFFSFHLPALLSRIFQIILFHPLKFFF